MDVGHNKGESVSPTITALFASQIQLQPRSRMIKSTLLSVRKASKVWFSPSSALKGYAVYFIFINIFVQNFQISGRFFTAGPQGSP